MAKLLDKNNRKMKSPGVLREQYRRGAKCMLEDCDNDLSIFDGPGGNILCEEHQL